MLPIYFTSLLLNASLANAETSVLAVEFQKATKSYVISFSPGAQVFGPGSVLLLQKNGQNIAAFRISSVTGTRTNAHLLRKYGDLKLLAQSGPFSVIVRPREDSHFKDIDSSTLSRQGSFGADINTGLIYSFVTESKYLNPSLGIGVGYNVSQTLRAYASFDRSFVGPPRYPILESE